MEVKAFEKKIWLASPTMHGDELKYVTEAYETNWMSTVGKNINEVERLICEKVGCKYAVALSAGTAAFHLAVKLAGLEIYGMPKAGHGVLEGKKVSYSVSMNTGSPPSYTTGFTVASKVMSEQNTFFPSSTP